MLNTIAPPPPIEGPSVMMAEARSIHIFTYRSIYPTHISICKRHFPDLTILYAKQVDDLQKAYIIVCVYVTISSLCDAELRPLTTQLI